LGKLRYFMYNAPMNRRERLENTIAGLRADRVPVALWRHFPGDDQRAADFAASIVDYQQRFDWDFVVIPAASTYSVADYSLQTDWAGDLIGDRQVVKHRVERSLDWTDIRTLDPERGELGKHMEVIRLVAGQLGDAVPLLMPVYSPLAQAERLAGRDLLLQHLRTQPDRVHSGLNSLTETTLRYLEALRRTGVSGILYVAEHATHESLSEAEYAVFGLPYDRKIMAELSERWWLNLLQLGGTSPMFHLIKDYPVQGVGWRTFDNHPDLPQGKSQILGAVCGGLSRWDDLQHGTPSTIRATIHSALQTVNERRMIVTAESFVPLTVPLSNLRAVRAAVELTRGSA
jgi:uroporphyrinogen decarboxylase